MEEEYEQYLAASENVHERLTDDLDPGMNPDERLDDGEIDAMEAAFYRGYYAEA